MGYLPQFFDLKNRYYYDPSLTDYKKGRKLYSKAAQVTLINDTSNNLDIMTNINTAIDFLEMIKNSEKAKEIACINYYSKILHEQMAKNNDATLTPIFDAIQKDIQDMNFEDLQAQQAHLIQRMSIIRSKPELYIKRLQNLLKEIPEDWNLEKAQQEDFLIGNQTFIEKILSSKENQSNYEEQIYNEIQNFIQNHLNFSKIQIGKQTSLIASIAADFRAYLQEKGENLIMNNKSIQQFQQYIQEEQRYFLKLLKDASSDQKQSNLAYRTLFTILEDMKTELGIMTEEKASSIAHSLLDQQSELQQEIKKLELQQNNNDKKTLEKIEELKKLESSINNRIERITKTKNGAFFRLHTNTSHGDLQEVITTLIYRALNVPGSAAVDHIGSITIDSRINDIFPVFSEMAKEMEKITQEHVKDRKNLTNYSEKYKQSNIKIQQILKAYQEKKANEQIPDYTQMFITNESAKLYWNAENKSGELSGRNIGIADALAQLYSIDEALMINQDVLIHIIVNLSSATAWQQSSLENHLSIFAGLLMFGDIYNMAQEAANFAQTNLLSEDIHVIHLYNIGEHFVPSSIVLENICNNFKEIANEASNIMSARATISPYQPQVEKNSTEDEWEKASNDALLKTKIQLHFLKGLFDFIREYNLLS